MIPVTARIAARYLLGRKSYSAVNAIALVSLCGIAIATAAIICVLSVFNGFRSVMGDRLGQLSPDIEVTLPGGKVFGGADSLRRVIEKIPGVESVQPTLTSQALALYGSREMPVMLKGVYPEKYRKAIPLDSLQIEGSQSITTPADPERESPASLAIGTAWQLGVPAIGEVVTIFAPRRVGRINPANPLSSFTVDSIETTGIFQTSQKQYDDNLVITDIGRVSELLQYDPGSATALEIKLTPGSDVQKLLPAIAAAAGGDFQVKDRLAQHEVNFRMVKIEKWITFLLLVFILAIASFNIISTLCMLVLEKRETIHVLSALGMTRRDIGQVFAWESWYVTLAGGLAGLVLGIGLCLLQQHYGLIRLNGDPSDLVLAAYPVKLEWSDLLWTILPVLVIGLVCAVTAAAYARRQRCQV